MNKRTDVIPTTLYDDEAVCFIADRYHSTPQQVVRCFLEQDGAGAVPNGESGTFRLEENEMEILRGLTFGNHS